jgi:hypothetical protein
MAKDVRINLLKARLNATEMELAHVKRNVLVAIIDCDQSIKTNANTRKFSQPSRVAYLDKHRELEPITEDDDFLFRCHR